jgi:phosphoribosylaminoimidazole-succinocarboxamide synthase
MLCGNVLPDGLSENDKLPQPILTPATKAVSGHDEDISVAEILERKLLSKKHLDNLTDISFKLFQQGTEFAASKGLILVDTKYEFGLHDNTIYLIDEVHTPDSSRFFYADTYVELQKAGKPQRQLSKEFVREWLMENGFQGLHGQSIPEMPDSFVASITNRYLELFEVMTGKPLDPRNYDNILPEIEDNITKELIKFE